MTASVSFGQMCLLPHLSEFKSRYPEITLELQLTDSVIDLVSGGIDLACRLTPKFDSALIGIRLLDTHYRVCVSPDYLESNLGVSLQAKSIPPDTKSITESVN